MAEPYQLRVVLCGVGPLLRWRLLIANESRIAELHKILQFVRGSLRRTELAGLRFEHLHGHRK